MSAGQTSLLDLRRRTDRQLVVLVRSEIEKALRIANRGAGPDAETRYRKARNLLTISAATEQERTELESRLKEVRAALDRSGAPPPGTRPWCRTSSCSAA